MADIAMSRAEGVEASSRQRAKALDAMKSGDAVFRGLTRTAAIGVLIILSGVIVSLAIGGLPALRVSVRVSDDASVELVTDRFGFSPRSSVQ